MSIKNKNKGGLPNDKMRIALLGSLLIVIIIVSISVASFYIGKKEGSEQSAIPIIDLSKTSSSQVLGATTYNWSGKILKVEGSKIVFTTQIQDDNNSLTTKEITAVIDSKTQLLKWDITKPSTPDQPDSNKEPISSNQLKPGQQIVVKSNNNLNNHDEIEASSISLLITPTNQ